MAFHKNLTDLKYSSRVLGPVTVKTLCCDVKYFMEVVIYRRAAVDVISRNNTLAWQTISKALVWTAPLISWKWKHLAIIHSEFLNTSSKVLHRCLTNYKLSLYLWLVAEVLWSFCRQRHHRHTSMYCWKDGGCLGNQIKTTNKTGQLLMKQPDEELYVNLFKCLISSSFFFSVLFRFKASRMTQL